MCEYMNYYLYLIINEIIIEKNLFVNLIQHMEEIGSLSPNFCHIYHEWFNSITDCPYYLPKADEIGYDKYRLNKSNLSILFSLITDECCPYYYIVLLNIIRII